MHKTPAAPYKPRSTRTRRETSTTEDRLPGLGRWPVCYMRKSKEAEDPTRMVSDQVQWSAITALAKKNGDDEPIIFADWFKSGDRKKLDQRVEYAALCDAVRSDRVSTVYVYHMTRLGRGVVQLLQFMEMCGDHGTKVEFAEGPLQGIDPNTHIGKMLLALVAGLAETELETIKERNRDVATWRKAEGFKGIHQAYGLMVMPDGKTVVPNPDEPAQVVVDTFKRVGSLAATARALTDAGVPTRRGAPWSRIAVRSVIKRLEPGLLPAKVERGVKPIAPYMFFRLLRCHCGRTLTGMRNHDRRRPHLEPFTHYRCSQSSETTGHGRNSISEARLIDWMKATAAEHMANVPDADVAAAEGNKARRAELEEELEIQAYLVGKRRITIAQYELNVAGIEAEMARLEAVSRLRKIPTEVQWDKPASVINSVLRAMFLYVQLDDDLMPVEAVPTTRELESDPSPAGPEQAVA